MDYPQTHYSRVKWAIGRALLGEVNPSLRGVCFEWDKEKDQILIYFYHDGVISDNLKDHYESIGCEASADFIFDDRLIKSDFITLSLPYPQKLPNTCQWVYARREPFVDP